MFISLQWLNFNRLVTLTVFMAIFTMALRYPMGADSWWHLRAGQLMVETQSWLLTDPFSQTQLGQPWINHGWLAQLFWYGLFALGGWTLLALGLAVIVTLSFWLVWLQAEGNLYLKAFVLILASLPASIIWSVRPQMISFLLTAVASWVLYRFKHRGGSLLPWLPIIMLIWVNSHGGFAIAFILLSCYLVGELFNRLTEKPNEESPFIGWHRWRHLLLTLGLCLMVVVINPHTWRMWLYPFQTVGIGVLRDFIAEWQSPSFHLPIIQPFLLLLLLTLTALARSQRRVDWSDLALLGAWTTLALFAVRNVPIFAVVCTPIIVRYGQAALEDQFGTINVGRTRRLSKPLSMLNWLLLGFIGLAALAQALVALAPSNMQAAEEAQFPAKAVRFVQETEPAGPMFNSYNIGGYLLYHLWPSQPVYVDGRTDLYNDEFLRAYLSTINALPGWEDRLNQAGIRLVFIEAQTPLSFALAQTPSWQETYSDDRFVIFERK